MPSIIPINLRTLRTAAIFASAEDTRYYLNGVCVEGRKDACVYVATDGHRLFARCHSLVNCGEIESPFIGQAIIPADECRAWKLGKRDNGDATLTVDKLTCSIDYEGKRRTFQAIDGTFPEYQRIIPTVDPKAGTAQFNGDYLASFDKAGRELELGRPFIHHNGPDNPALVTWDESTFGIIMPMRGKPQITKAPRWARGETVSPPAVAAE